MATPAPNAAFRFESEYLPPDTFSVLSFEGEEAISHLFRFEIELASRDPNVDLGEALAYPASLRIETHGRATHFHGILAELELGAELANGMYAYRAVLVPRLWLWSLSRQNQIHQKLSVPAIVEQELADTANKGDHPLLSGGLRGDDLELNLMGDYPEREYVVQYRESDLNFLSRLLEHDGIFYFFEHGEEAEKLFIGDHNTCFPEIPEVELPYRSPAGLVSKEGAAVYAIRSTRRQLPYKVLLRDYDYRQPHVLMQAEREIDGTGLPEAERARGAGFVAEYGAHFKTEDEGERLAGARAEEFACTRRVFEAESDCASLRSGHCFALGGHFREDWNARLLVTRVRHRGEQSVAGVSGAGAGEATTTYSNAFSAIPSEVPFRPARTTPKPRLYGLMNGTIDGEQGLDRAEIDEQGRYKVKMPFDISGAAAGRASRYLRMAQPYAGGQQGMHFPLHPGTEIVWACIDGDLDRPIILSAVPNPQTKSVVTAENSTSNVIRTASGIVMGFHDGSGSPGQSTAGRAGEVAAQQQYQFVGPQFALSQDRQAPSIDRPALAASWTSPANPAGRRLALQQQQVEVSDNMSMDLGGVLARADAGLWGGEGKRWVIRVPDYDETGEHTPDSTHNDSYLRLGKASTPEIDAGGGWQTNGWLDYTDGDRVSVTHGDRTDYTRGTHTVESKKSTYSYKAEGATTYAMTAENSHSLGLKTSSAAGLSVSSALGVNVSLKTGIDFNFANSRTYSYAKGTTFTSSAAFRQEVDKEIALAVDPLDSWYKEQLMENVYPNAARAIAIASSAIAGAIAAGGKYDGGSTWNRLADGHAALMALFGAAMAGTTLKWNSPTDPDEPASEFIIRPNTAELNVAGVAKDIAEKSLKTTDKKTISVKAMNKLSDENPVHLRIERLQEGGRIDLVAGKEGDGKASSIRFKVGKSSIEIYEDQIYFISDCFVFMNKGFQTLAELKESGLLLEAGDLQIKKDIKTGGDVSAKGSVSAKKITPGEASMGSPASPPKLPKAKKQKEPDLSYLKVKIGTHGDRRPKR